METKIRKCTVCNNEYKFCPRCKEDKNKELWHFSFCSSNCKNIYQITSDFENGQASLDDTRTELSKLDLSKIENFRASYQSSLKKIIPEKTGDKTIDNVTDNEIEDLESSLKSKVDENKTKTKKTKKISEIE